MWTRIVCLSVSCAAALYGAALLAAEPACSNAPAGSLWSQTPWLSLQIVGGRIAATSSRCGSHRLTTEPADGATARQHLLMQVQPGAMTVHYEQIDERSELVLTVDERGRLTISRQGREGHPQAEVRYTQPPAGDVTLSIGGPSPQKHSAATLWHLVVIEPAASREHLMPLLAQLRPTWRVEEQAQQLEAALVARAGEDPLPVRRQWQAWVEQLASDEFRQRQAADRGLRAGGQPAIGFLRQVPTRQLSPEQRRRIAGILASGAASDADSPARAADWLLADKRVWLALMSRGELDQRVAAAQHLTCLCGRSVAFNPEAAADQRQAQLVELQAKLAEN
jgi:hypothetical protein